MTQHDAVIQDQVTGLASPGGRLSLFSLLISVGMLVAVYSIFNLCPVAGMFDSRIAIGEALCFGLISAGFIGGLVAYRGLSIWLAKRFEIGGSLWVIPVALVGMILGVVNCGYGLLLLLMVTSQIKC